MKNLVRRINTLVICDTYTCSNIAEFEISHEVVRAVSMQVCPECLKDIVEQGAQLLGISMCGCCSEDKTEKTEENEQLPFDDTEEENEQNEVSEKNIKEISESGINTEPIIGAEDEKEDKAPVKVYTCKHCGKEFTDLKEYRGHILQCGKKAKEQ